MELFIRMNLQAGAPDCRENNTRMEDLCVIESSEFGSVSGYNNYNISGQLIPGRYNFFQACTTGVCIPETICRDPAW